MANWNQPTVGSDYISVLQELKDRDVDSATMFSSGAPPSNLPVDAIRWNSVGAIFQQWDGDSWEDLILGLTGGGTGSTTPSGIRTNLGLGTMATQNNNAVNITGGSISGINFDAGSITSGIIALARGGTSSSLAYGGDGTVMVGISGAVAMASGANIANLNANNLTTGIVPLARISGITDAQISTISYAKLNLANSIVNADINTSAAIGWTKINKAGSSLGDLATRSASDLNVGTVPLSRLGAGGTPDTSTFLRGDNTWQVPPAPSSSFPSGFIGMFDTACPAGWTRVVAADNRYLMGGGSFGVTGGRGVHGHYLNGNTANSGDHNHHLDITRRSGNIVDYGTGNYQPGSSPIFGDHKHDVRIDGDTQNNGTHSHFFETSTATEALDPYFFTVVVCRKD